MKNLLLIVVALIVTSSINSQQINFSFANAQNTNDGSNDYYEVDVLISSDADFKLGSGQLYFTYNTDAFGINSSDNGGLTYVHAINGGGYILDEHYLNVAPVYGNFIQNDNTLGRISLAFIATYGTSTVSTNVTITPTPLMHIKMRYADVSKSPNFLFEEGPIFLNQFFTACGDSGFAFSPADCTNKAGTQITAETFNSSGATLGFRDYELLVGITMFPNPTSDTIFIKGLEEKANVKIYNSLGAMVLENKNYLNGEISLHNISTGVYFVKIQNEKGVCVKEIIKN